MQRSLVYRASLIRAVAFACAAAGVSGCTIENQAAPELSGPSEIAKAVSLVATPDRLPQDGVSETVVSALVRNEKSEPIVGMTLRWSVSASDGSTIEPSSQLTTTDAQGRTSTRVKAPSAPPQMPSSPLNLTISATPVGNNIASETARSVVVQLIPPAGTPSINRLPQPSFSISPAVSIVNQMVKFDASDTKDEGINCGGRCSYAWDFGDASGAGGINAEHRFMAPGTFSITLTVVDERGGVGSLARSLAVSGPTAPIAAFTPVTAAANTSVVFNGSTSSVGAGATITEYSWDFGDNTSAVSTLPVTTKAGGYPSGFYNVTLTVTDSFGRTAKKTSLFTVP